MAQVNRVGLGRNLTAAEVDNNFAEALAAAGAAAATASAAAAVASAAAVATTTTAALATKADGAATTAALATKADAAATTAALATKADGAATTASLATKASLPQNSLAPASSTVAPTVDAVNTGLATKAPSTGIANAALAPMPANTGKFNLTGSAAVPTDATLATIEAALATVRSPGGSLKEPFLNGVSSISLPFTGSTTIQSVGMSTSLDGTATARIVVLSGRAEYYVIRVGAVSAVTTANAEIGFRTSANVALFPGSDAQSPPVVVKVRAVPSDAIASAARIAIGISASTPALGTVNPSATLNCIMLAADDTDTQMFVMHNDGAGTCTRIALNGGTGFPANSNSSNDYSFYVKAVGGTTRSATWVATNHVTNLVVTGTITTDLPVAGATVLGVARRGNAANTGIAPSIDFVAFASGGFAELPGGGGGAGTWGSITGTISTQADLLPFVDPVVPANETIARAVVLTDDNQTIPVNSATTTAYTMAAGLGMLRGVRFLQLGTGSITLTIGATVTVNGVLGSVTPTLTLTTTQYTGASLIKLAAADTYVLM